MITVMAMNTLMTITQLHHHHHEDLEDEGIELWYQISKWKQTHDKIYYARK